MSVKGIHDSRIVNPMAKVIVSLEVTDDGQTRLHSSLPPDALVKLLLSTSVDVIFGYVDSLVEEKVKKSDVAL